MSNGEEVIVMARYPNVSPKGHDSDGWNEQFRGTDLGSAFVAAAEARQNYQEVKYFKEVELRIGV